MPVLRPTLLGAVAQLTAMETGSKRALLNPIWDFTLLHSHCFGCYSLCKNQRIVIIMNNLNEVKPWCLICESQNHERLISGLTYINTNS